MSDLDIDKKYPISEIKRLSTKYGEKIIVELEDGSVISLPQRHPTGISVKAGSSFVPPAVASVSFSLQTLSFHSGCKKKQHSPFHCVFGTPRTRFRAVKPSLPALFPSPPRDFTPVSSSSAALFLKPSPAWGGNSDIGLSFSTFLRDSGYKRFISLALATSNFRFVSLRRRSLD
ncbi:hypothetical protein TNCV_3428181 [Trichonephila clavipes]|nr:hypothetical protein TNCV_3428181 [Trichonephila clavipes]